MSPDDDTDTPRLRSERILERLGHARVEPTDIELAVRLTDGLTTRGGAARRVRLENCGVAFPVLVRGEQVAWERRGCGDRFCPDCAAKAARKLAASVRELWAEREGQGRRGLFITLTQRKHEGESARAAVDRVLKSWRMVSNCRHKLARGLLRGWKKGEKAMLPGGMRTLEVTAREPGEIVNGVRIGLGGIHAHLHVLAELSPTASPRTVAARLREVWCQVADAEPHAQDVQALRTGNIKQACKYAADFSNLAQLLDVAPGYCRAVVRALHGRILVGPWGSWKGALPKPAPELRYGDRSIVSLVMSPEGSVEFGDVTWDADKVLVEVANCSSWSVTRSDERQEGRERVADLADRRELQREERQADARRARAAASLTRALRR